jgi:hypothetical protein
MKRLIPLLTLIAGTALAAPLYVNINSQRGPISRTPRIKAVKAAGWSHYHQRGWRIVSELPPTVAPYHVRASLNWVQDTNHVNKAVPVVVDVERTREPYYQALVTDFTNTVKQVFPQLDAPYPGAAQSTYEADIQNKLVTARVQFEAAAPGSDIAHNRQMRINQLRAILNLANRLDKKYPYWMEDPQVWTQP